ncbi:MAG: ATP-binding cassette domain-containing protein [Oscillospiraceae bacterium]|jgi:peptide/nickel transport system ATP-binding protein|nr:ATP-binding cassette domain-containing protein [Oscillospiraceae bacterium]
MLAANDVTKRYNGAEVLRGVTLSVQKGEIVGLVGESGSGKSTLARLLCGLERTDSGTISEDARGEDMRGRRMRRRVQMIFQDASGSLDPKRTAAQSIAEPLENFERLRGAAKARRVSALLQSVGLSDGDGARVPHELSGGQRQRVVIARALAASPEYLICDEPTSGLDAPVQTRIIELLRELRRERGMGVLFITHDIALAQTLCNRVCTMSRGKISDEITAIPASAARVPSARCDAEILLSVRDASVQFPSDGGAETVLEHFNLEVRQGEIVGLVGESGCGKTVFAASLLGILERPGIVTAGTAHFLSSGGEIDLYGLSEHALRRLRGRELAMIFHDPVSALNPSRTVAAQFIESIRACDRSKSRAQSAALAEETLAQMRFDAPGKILSAYPFELSGGMCQRVMIAMATALRPRLLIADEPTTALDIRNQAKILQLFREIRDSFGTSILLISHDAVVLETTADRMVQMRKSNCGRGILM